MLGKTHTMMALAASAPLAFIAPEWAFQYIVAGAAIGGLFPDIDEPGSTISRKVLFVSYILSLFIEHRGITHTFVAIFLYILIAAGAFSYFKEGWIIWFSLAFIVGNIAHIVGDMMTRSGVAILNPFTNKKFHLLPQRVRLYTGGAAERLIFLPIMSLLMVFIYIPHASQLFSQLIGK